MREAGQHVYGAELLAADFKFDDLIRPDLSLPDKAVAGNES